MGTTSQFLFWSKHFHARRKRLVKIRKLRFDGSNNFPPGALNDQDRIGRAGVMAGINGNIGAAGPFRIELRFSPFGRMDRQDMLGVSTVEEKSHLFDKSFTWCAPRSIFGPKTFTANVTS
jgi:hypothetical protein